MVKKALRSLYRGRCTIQNTVEIENPETGKTNMEFITVATDQPCRLSFGSVPTTEIKDNVAQVAQITKLFIDPEVEIKAGSIIEVTQNNKTQKYKASSAPIVHTNHQEIQLELEERYA